MARPSRLREVVTARSSSTDESQQGGSESDEEDEMLKMGEQMLQASRRRRDARRKIIVNEHKKRVKDTKARILKLYEDRKDEVQKVRKSQWERLGALIRKRKAIEARIFAQMKAIETTRSSLSTTLAAVFVGRQEDVAESREITKE